MSDYKAWSATCAGCSTQNGSSVTPCTNCGRGPLLAWITQYRRIFLCQYCGEKFNNAICVNCGMLVGARARRNPSTLAALVGVVAILALLYWQFRSCGSSSDQTAGHNPSTPQPTYAREPFSPGNFAAEGAIRSAVQEFTDDWNSSNAAGIKAMWCSSAKHPPDTTVVSKQIIWFGQIETSVKEIGGSGNEASADVTVMSANRGGQRLDWWFVKEGGRWKPCDVSFLWTKVPPGQ
jgi:hypothetical protein